MKNRTAFFMLLAFTVLAGCSRENVELPDDDILYARIENPADSDTKSYVSDDCRVLWDNADAASVFRYVTINQKYVYSGSAGTNNASFSKSGSASGTGSALDNIYAVYPYSSAISMSAEGTIKNVQILGTQSYKEHSFGKAANVAVSATENNDMFFQNLCGYLKLSLYGDNVTVSKITLQSNNGEIISGYATVSAAPRKKPTLSFVSSKSSSITLSCPGGVKLGTSKSNATDFWFVIPPVTLSGGFKITVYENDSAIFEKKASSRFTIERNLLKNMAPLKVEKPTGLISFTLSPSPVTMYPFDQVKVTAVLNPSSAEIKSEYWYIDADRIAGVGGGGDGWRYINAFKPGTAVLRVVLNGNIEKTVTINVLDPAPAAVDLGLSVQWGDRNLFAEKASDTGRYYDFTNALGYQSTSSDVAEYFTDGEWRLPTKAECQELIDKCTYTKETLNGVTGLRFKSKSNGASVFLPDVGGYLGSTYYGPSSMGCFYWSKTIANSNSHRLYWTVSSHSPSVSVLETLYAKDYKFVVRPVKAK
ncbi:MAG: hypothetical protein J6O51_01705 [Bacteroidales bacterium]|nr:hypothetical protein [Bacteroidales bacterium]